MVLTGLVLLGLVLAGQPQATLLLPPMMYALKKLKKDYLTHLKALGKRHSSYSGVAKKAGKLSKGIGTGIAF